MEYCNNETNRPNVLLMTFTKRFISGVDRYIDLFDSHEAFVLTIIGGLQFAVFIHQCSVTP